MHGIVHTILDMKRTSHTQRHRYEFFSRRSPTRLIILCLCSVLAGIIFTGLFFLCPIIPSHTGNRDRDSSFYLHVSSKTMMVLRAIPIRYRADMEDHLQLSARSISMVSLIDDAVNLTFDGTMNRGTDAKEEFDWTPMEATALHALKSGDFFPPFISQSTSRRDSTLSNSESRLNYGREDQIISTTTNVLCTTFAPLRRNAFSSIMHKLFANHASSMSSHQMSENQSRKRHQLSSNATAVTCDWLVLFYEGDQTLLSELQENILQKTMSVGSTRRIHLKWMDRSITQRVARQQLLNCKRGYMHSQKGTAKENTIKGSTHTRENERATDGGTVENAYQRFVSISQSTVMSDMPFNVYVHSKLFLYLALLDKYDDQLPPSPVNRVKETNQPSSSSLPLLLHYTHVWLIDHDINLYGFNLTSYLRTLRTARFPSAPDAPCARNDLLLPSIASSVMISQPLLQETTQTYKYFHSNAWKAEEQKMQNGLFSFLQPTKTSPRVKIIAAETRFIEIQAPLFDSYFFHWFLRFFVVPLLGASHVLGADWGLDALFCTAASVYRKEYIAYISMQRDREAERQKGLSAMKTSTTSSSSSTTAGIDTYMSDIKGFRKGLGEVVCALITTGHPLQHVNTKTMDSLYHVSKDSTSSPITPSDIKTPSAERKVLTGKRSKELLNHAMMAIISMAFPHFYLSGSTKSINPLLNRGMRRIDDSKTTVKHADFNIRLYACNGTARKRSRKDY